MRIIRAEYKHIGAISAIYEAIHDMEEAGQLTIGWIRGIYPTAKTAEAALERGDLFVEMDGDTVVGSAIINQIQPDGYRSGKWTVSVPDDQIMVLHTLVIDPSRSGQGYGRRFVDYYEQVARKNGCPVLRMDTNSKNTNARRLYARLGYRETDIVPCVFNGIPDVRLVLLEKVLSL